MHELLYKRAWRKVLSNVFALVVEANLKQIFGGLIIRK